MSDDKMNPEAKAAWVKALRSGEYKQCTGALRNDDGFCCLGVLTDVAIKTGAVTAEVLPPLTPDEMDPVSGYLKPEADERKVIDGYTYVTTGPGIKDEGQSTFTDFELTPVIVAEWAGINVDPKVMNENGENVALSGLNDRGRTFEQIADFIEEQL